jgi:hypothetical protein
MGLSYGGLATYLASFDRELRDSRIEIAVTLAGAGGDFLQPRFYDFVRRPLPLLAIHGTADALVEYDTVAGEVFENANWPTLALELEGGSHIGFVDPAPVIPGTHPDYLACMFFPPVDPSDPAFGEAFAYLAGRIPDTGFAIPGEAPLPCTYGAQTQTSWMELQRQLDLTKAGILAFSLSHFGEDLSTRSKAQTFLYRTFNDENPDATLERKPFSWDWLGTY